MHLMSQMSYCLSVSLIWSDDGQLPFWAAKSRNILAARLAANKARWNSLARVSPFTLLPLYLEISILLLWRYHRCIKVHLSLFVPPELIMCYWFGRLPVCFSPMRRHIMVLSPFTLNQVFVLFCAGNCRMDPFSLPPLMKMLIKCPADSVQTVADFSS